MKYTCNMNKDDLSVQATVQQIDRLMAGRLGAGDLSALNIFSPFSLFYFLLPRHREVGQQKRVLMSGPSWRSVPKSKSSGAILQELPSPSWGGGTNAGVFKCTYLHKI